jgi:hypothetical protein
MRVGSDLNLVGVARLFGLARLLVNYVIGSITNLNLTLTLIKMLIYKSIKLLLVLYILYTRKIIIYKQFPILMPSL